MPGRVDYDEEAHKLFTRLGLDAKDGRPAALPGGEIYAPMDPIWRDEATGGIIYVGNQTAASTYGMLRGANITHVVNCTDNMPNFQEGKLEYYRFNISFWPSSADDAGILRFVAPCFEFIDRALAAGGSVLVHCLAGAHRAGTTGCLLLMYKAQLGQHDAVRAAKKLRPVIDPIGRLPEFLSRYQRARRAEDGAAPAPAAPAPAASPRP